ncbi:MAG: glycosyltransferase family 4 protein [Candidatus Nezhaarchaeota archaeon]|nr:glycosyltransferase family 4 protein [Candidatus Nezhaarchaeota archaeon]
MKQPRAFVGPWRLRRLSFLHRGFEKRTEYLRATLAVFMKIAFVTTEYPPTIYGGLGVYSEAIATRLSKLGHEVHVFTINPSSLPKYSAQGGVHVHRLRPVDASSPLRAIVNDELRAWGPGFKFFSDVLTYNVAAALAMVSGGAEFDLVAVHDWLSSIAGVAVKDEAPHVPLVFHIHSTERGRNLGGGSPTVIRLELMCAEKADAVVAVSHALRDYDLAPQGFPIHKVHVVWNGVDPDVYSPLKVPEEAVRLVRAKCGATEGPLILFVGRLVRAKGVDKLVESMKHIVKDYPRSKLVVIGKGDMYQHLLDLASKLGLSSYVLFINSFLSEEEKVVYYAACDVAVFPSLYEPFGIVALEAMAMERPVVVGASGCSGLREIVVPSGAYQCGVHVNPHDPQDIAWGVRAVLSSQDRGRWMGANGRRRVLESFTWDKAASRTLEVYKTLAK